eukprot:TRINITY_DN2616_c0_g1_i4.p1 TRINITY_DN2616_c0_g1~~TRINITY_DN2616_c0_g1_i4.p1  ORF type:complete len:328 (+),score=106.41 TRINITY_DN2616_c0_g1_i4:78-1061(+)
MEDRLAELRKGTPASTDDIELEEQGKKGKGKKEKKSADNEGEGTGGDEFMNDFFQDVGAIKAAMSTIRRNIKSVEDKYVSSLNSITADQNAKASSEIQGIIEETNKMTQEVRSRLENLKINNDAYAKSKAATATELRIRTNMQGTLTQKFVELMKDYQEVQTNYRNRYKEKVEHQYKIAKPDATQEEIDTAIESGDSAKVFQNQILDTHLHTQAKNALAYIQDRHRDIILLEESIRELHQLFLDMSVLVASQGELIDQIEYNVNQSVDYTQQGVEELRKAIDLQKKSRKKMIILIVIAIIIIVVILAPTLSTQINKKNAEGTSVTQA